MTYRITSIPDSPKRCKYCGEKHKCKCDGIPCSECGEQVWVDGIDFPLKHKPTCGCYPSKPDRLAELREKYPRVLVMKAAANGEARADINELLDMLEELKESARVYERCQEANRRLSGEIADLKAELKESNEAVQRWRGHWDHCRGKIEELEAKLAAKEREVERCRHAIRSGNDYNGEQCGEIDKLKDEIVGKLKAALEAKDAIPTAQEVTDLLHKQFLASNVLMDLYGETKTLLLNSQIITPTEDK